MRKSLLFAAVLSLPVANAQQATQPVALTIYNQNFAVARTAVDLDLHPGVNEVTTTDVTRRLEPDSVILRDPSGKRAIHILEQSYDGAVVTQDWLLQKYEGKTIEFEAGSPQGQQIVQGKIIRAPFVRPAEYMNGQYVNAENAQPLIEVNGKMEFQLPGLPLFPADTNGLLLKPTLRWRINSEESDRFTAELAYVTSGMDWEATYNVVVPDSGDVTGDEKAAVLGWVTIHNQSGTDFPAARIKLMAGDVAKIQPQSYGFGIISGKTMAAPYNNQQQVTQTPFDDFHLYDLHRTVALHDGETKQVQFLDASGVTVHRTYVYDGTATAQLQPIYSGNVNQQQGYGLDNGDTKVRIVEEIKNSESNHLGMPLPAGRVRLYRRDADGQMEFVGENSINHTPAEETVKLVTGSAFDLKGSRRQTDFNVDYNRHELHESFEIKIANQKQQQAEVAIVEPMYRGVNWEITSKSSDFTKLDSRTVQFQVQVPAKGETTLTYSVRYTW
ncbi:MAG: DUF4139 domain-containing protein [Terracidiphilus sp.]